MTRDEAASIGENTGDRFTARTRPERICALDRSDIAGIMENECAASINPDNKGEERFLGNACVNAAVERVMEVKDRLTCELYKR